MSAVATVAEETTNRLAGFVPVQVRMLRTTQSDVSDLFVQYDHQTEPVLYCSAGSCPDAQQFTELAESGIDNLYLRSADFATLSNELMSSLESLLKRDDIRKGDKFAALQIAVAVSLEQTLRLVDCSKFHALAEKIGDDLVRLFDDGAIRPRELFRMARHDFNTFTHVTNVASYCVLLAKNMGICSDDDLRRMAVASILHDLGKRFIPSRILTKTARLTPEERELVESHPTRGYVELCDNAEFNWGQLMMVYQHHERMDGTGYPVQVVGDEIHPWARILSVVDVFDTMTAKRPEARPATPESALEYQREQAGKQFDREVVECWISTMTKT